MLRAFLLLLVHLFAPGGLSGREPLPPAANPESYAADRECAACHRAIAGSYRQVGMARSFGRPGEHGWIEDLDAGPFLHQPSQRHYQMERRGDDLYFRRYQIDGAGEPIHLLEQKVDWVMGSGSTSRVYLFRTPAGELYQLPLAWYSQIGRWQMAPGFDRVDHQGLGRRVRRECMFCHNAYPAVPAGSDLYGAPQVFPEALPSGLGCQRCHGPGSSHVAAARGGATPARIRDTIVNPARLPRELRADVCNQCHFQTSVAIPGVRRLGRGDWSYRPGEPLDQYLVATDIVEEHRPRDERFEINHHAYRLEQSRCFEQSAGALECGTCHDSHRKPTREQLRHEVDRHCLACHTTLLPAPGHAGERRDCAGCHMPRRRTQDVVHVLMTDHRIQRPGTTANPLAPLAETDPAIVDVAVLSEHREDPQAELYRVLAVVRAAALGEALDRLEGLLAERLELDRPASDAALLEPYLDLARGRLQRGDFERARATLELVLGWYPDHPLGLEWRALVDAGQGRLAEAQAGLARIVELAPGRAEAHYNLGRVALARAQAELARAELETAVALRPLLAPAWRHLGEALVMLERVGEAAAAFRRALEVEPALTPAYAGLVRAYLRLDQPEPARRYLEHGLRVAARPEELEALRAELP